MTSKIPPLLLPYINGLPRDSLTLLTSVLAASTNWLIIRYLYAALDPRARSKHGTGIPASEEPQPEAGSYEEEVKIVLVSWMRDWEFWKAEARRAVGLDLVKLYQQQRIIFIDGLANLYGENIAPTDRLASGGTSVPTIQSRERQPRSEQPLAQSAGRNAHQGKTEAHSPTSSTFKPSSAHTLKNPTLKHLANTIQSAISALAAASSSPSNIVLILDTPSVLLQTTTPSITSVDLTNTLLALRALAYATVVAVPTDAPLLAPASSLASPGAYNTSMSTDSAAATPLETENAAFIVGLAHQARCVLSCRMLGTGFAEDVSGVLRATRGGGVDDYYADGEGGENVLEEGEWLYFVGGDGGVRVWGRGGLDGG